MEQAEPLQISERQNAVNHRSSREDTVLSPPEQWFDGADVFQDDNFAMELDEPERLEAKSVRNSAHEALRTLSELPVEPEPPLVTQTVQSSETVAAPQPTPSKIDRDARNANSLATAHTSIQESRYRPFSNHKVLRLPQEAKRQKVNPAPIQAQTKRAREKETIATAYKRAGAAAQSMFMEDSD
jgi:hypothetical protein